MPTEPGEQCVSILPGGFLMLSVDNLGTICLVRTIGEKVSPPAFKLVIIVRLSFNLLVYLSYLTTVTLACTYVWSLYHSELVTVLLTWLESHSGKSLSGRIVFFFVFLSS